MQASVEVSSPSGQTSASIDLNASQQYLRLAVGGELYAVPIESVREILEVGQLTPLPMTPDFVHGVMNLRGAVVPVIDLHARFGQARSRIGKRSCIVIVETGDSARDGSRVVGALVDGVSEVMEIAASEIEPAPPLGTRIPAEFIQGMAHTKSAIYVVLDLARTLAEEEMASLIANPLN